MTDPLFDPVACGDIACANRIVMAPMTRSRATAGDRPDALQVRYYAARAAAGLIVTEGTQPSIHGKGYARTPGLYEPAQVEAWREVTGAVHAAGGHIVVQLMHTGRVASRHNKAAGARTVAPSAVRAQVSMFTDAAGMQDCDEPEALTLDGIRAVIDEYVAAAHNAHAAGFDGVELHAASGYLPMQFLCASTNQRSDPYGGSAAARARFTVELMEALCGALGAGRVGIRICPGNPFNDVADPDPPATYTALLSALRPLRYAWLHVIRSPLPGIDAFALARQLYDGTLIINDGFDPASARAAITAGQGDAVAFARLFIGNPDLVRRIREGLPLAGFDRNTLYTPGAAGYTDYPEYGAG
ncbi:MAG: alkene reductase [Gammaproteobacteria bacterium]|nr:alkene reductase [Gammaproteobacteria bacterium]